MPAPIINIANTNISFGTCDLGTTYGQIEDAELQRTAEELGIPDCHGGFQGYLLMNPGYTFTFTAIIPASAELPELGDAIAFPHGGVIGNITDFTENWTKGPRKISVTAKNWDSIGSNPAVTALPAA
jgi:hypothetical protein